MTKITGKSEATAEQMTAYIKAKNGSVAQSVLDMIPLYLSEGEAENIRGDIAFAQSCLETGNFTFSGSAVELSQNNFCGMGVTQNGETGNSFKTPQLGIRAQIQHLKLFEEYVLRGSDHQEERRKLNERYLSGEELMGEHGLRKELAAFDMSYFGRAYLPHYFIRKSPHFHEELDEIWSRGVMKGRNPLKEAKVISRLKGSRQVVAAPRGHAKSTNFTFKDSLHAILYAYKHYILILSDSSEQAEGFLDDIKTELEDNANIIMDFGSLKGDKAWRTGVILTKTDIKAEAIGSGKKVRGRRHRNWRPDLIVLDDIENDENVNTPEQRRKLKNWFDKAVYKTLACDMGLEIPKSHIYKKFNIPKPENGEEVLKPPQAGMMTAQQQPMETTEELKLKQEEGQAEQRQVDTIVSIANKQSEDIFREMMKPIFKMIDKAEDMDELQKVLKDEKKLRELYQDMESPELEDLIQQGIYLSHLIGRSMD